MFRLPRFAQWTGGAVMALLVILGLVDVPDQLEVVRKWMDEQGADRVRLAMVAVGTLGFLYFALNERVGRWFNPVSILDACLTSPPMWRLGIENRGRTERFRVKVSELAGTDADEEPWNLPWRLSDAHYHEIQHGETEVVNLAQADGDHDLRVGVAIDFFSQSVDRFSRTLWPGGFAVGVEVFAESGNGARARRQFQMMLDEGGEPVLVPHPGSWPRLVARIAAGQVKIVRWFKAYRPSLARLRVRLAEQIAPPDGPESELRKVPVGGTMPPPSGELEIEMVEQDETADEEREAQPELAGSGIHHEVKWIGLKYPNGYIEPDGPFCPRDDTRLKFTHGTGDEPGLSEPNDHDIIGPSVTGGALFCETCRKRYYLDATTRDARRLGAARDQARRSLFRPLTALERSIRRLGL